MNRVFIHRMVVRWARIVVRELHVGVYGEPVSHGRGQHGDPGRSQGIVGKWSIIPKGSRKLEREHIIGPSG